MATTSSANPNPSDDKDKNNEVLEKIYELFKQAADDIRSFRESRDHQEGLGAGDVNINKDAGQATDAIKAPLTANEKQLAAIREALRSQVTGSNSIGNLIKSASKLAADNNIKVKEGLYGDATVLENAFSQALEGSAAKQFYKGLMELRVASTSLSSITAFFKTIKGVGNVVGAAARGDEEARQMVGNIVGGFAAGGPIGGLGAAIWELLKKTIVGQLMLGWTENKGAFVENYTNARRLSALSGNTNWNTPNINAAGYNSYRSYMRLNGMRDDEQIFNSMQEMVRQGMAGINSSLNDAFMAGLSNQMSRNRFGLDYSPAFAGQLMRQTAGVRNQSALYDRSGAFNLMNMSAGLSYMTRRSTDPTTGLQVSMDTFKELVEGASKGLRGMNNNIPALMANLASWSNALRENKITKDELLGMYTGANQGSTLDDKLQALAFSGFQGDYMAEAWKWVERSATASGRIQNLQMAAKGALGLYRQMGSGSPEQKMIAMETLRNNPVTQHLYNNPRFLEILRQAAAGNRSAIDELNKSMQGDSAELQHQSQLLDAIRNPLEHLRDFAFSKLTDSTKVPEVFEKGRQNALAYDWYLKGYDNKEAQDIAKRYREEERKDAASNYKHPVEEIFKAIDETFARGNVKGEINEILRVLKENLDGRNPRGGSR